jgi:AraC-like DNA-binding protein
MDTLQQPSRFSIWYRGTAEGQNYRDWRDGICRGFCHLDVGPAGNDFIDCHNDFALIHSVALATPKGISARFARTRDLLDDGCDDFVLISASHGTVRVTKEQKTIDLSEGQMCLTEMNVVGAADLNSAGGFTTTRIPRQLLLQIAPKAERHLARPIGNSRALVAMFDRYFTLCNEVAQDLDAAGQKAAAQHLTDLVALLLGNGSDHKELALQRGFSSARLDLMKTEVLKDLTSPGLTIANVAHCAGLSERQAQRLFAQSGTTFSEFVLEQRLLLARRILLSEYDGQRKVSDAAYTAGFNDLSYFNRSFRKRFGVTPSDVQAEFNRSE